MPGLREPLGKAGTPWGVALPLKNFNSCGSTFTSAKVYFPVSGLTRSSSNGWPGITEDVNPVK